MAESAEHKFIKECINNTLRDFSNTQLYQYFEADRNKFDLACALKRDWTRLMVGQVLWKNTRGVEKDIRTLLNEVESDIKLYAISSFTAHETALMEVLGDYKRSGRYPDLYKVKVIKIPADLDLDKEQEVFSVRKIIENQIVDDILLNVVFSNISLIDLKLLSNADGGDGIYISLLHSIAIREYPSIAALARSLGVSTSPVREILQFLFGLGLLEPESSFSSKYVVSQKGRVLLSILEQLYLSYRSGNYSNELLFILRKLGCAPQKNKDLLEVDLTSPQGYIYPLLILGLRSVSTRGEFKFDGLHHSGSLCIDVK